MKKRTQNDCGETNCSNHREKTVNSIPIYGLFSIFYGLFLYMVVKMIKNNKLSGHKYVRTL